MVSIPALWLPILLSAVVVWVLSAIIWMFLWHKKDFKRLPDEDAVRVALGSQNAPPGQYWLPWADQQSMKDEAVQQKYREGPVGILTVMQPGMPSMGKNMGLAFVYYLVAGIFVAYIASRYLDPGAAYLAAFRLTSVVAFLAYGFGIMQDAIWFGRPWGFSLKIWLDALIYGLLTGGVFGWLWPG
jgi:hypothetical protein